MALSVDLAPYERIIIANVSVRNGDRRARLTFETEAKFLREKDMLPASEASTACEHLYVLLQMIYFLDLNTDLDQKFINVSQRDNDCCAEHGAIYCRDIQKYYGRKILSCY